MSPSPFNARVIYTEEPYSINSYQYYTKGLKIEDSFSDEYNEMPHISSGPEKSGNIRIYGVVHPNRIIYRSPSTTYYNILPIQLTHNEPSPWTNITSNVAEHATYNMIAFGVNNTYNGAAKFRKRNYF